MRTLDELYSLYASRRRGQSANQGLMVDLALVYDGGLVTRIAEVDEVAESAVPNLVAQGIDQYARFSASVMPQVTVPPVRRNIAASRKKASQRQRVYKGWWDGSQMSVLGYQRARYYYGYGAAPVVLRSHPDKVGVPVWEARNPIGVLPGPRDTLYSPAVPDCFLGTARSVRWVRDNYGLDLGMDLYPDRLVEVVEYDDPEQKTCFVVGGVNFGKTPQWLGGYGPAGLHFGHYSGGLMQQVRSGKHGWLCLLSTSPNYAGVCTVSAPGVISLSKQQGFVSGILSKHHLQARLMHLTVKAIAKGIHPDEWMVTDPNSNGTGIVREADGLRGIRGHIDGGSIEVPQVSPSYLTFNLLDRLESYQRSEAGISSDFGGENPTGVRTRANGDRLSGVAVEPRVREYHEILQKALEHENAIAVAIAKGYGGSRSFSMHVTMGKETVAEEYVPNEVFENDVTVVRYALAGADMNGQIIATSQSIGTGQMSTATARTLNPLVEDPIQEAADIRAEAAEQVLLASLQALVESSPADAAFITRRLREGAMPEDVWDEAQRRAQERQASAGELGAPDGPVVPGSPEAQPGLGLPGGGGEAPPVIEEPPPALRNLAALATATRRPQMTVPAERAG